MSTTPRSVIASTVLALVAGLLLVPVLSAPATAQGAPGAERTAACTQAINAQNQRQAKRKKVKKRAVKARKQFRKAKRVNQRVGTPRAAKAQRKARVKVKRLNTRFKRARKAHKRAVAERQRVCATQDRPLTPEEQAEVDAMGELLGLLTGLLAGGSLDHSSLSPTQLTNVLNAILPGAGSQLDPSALAALLGGLGGFDADSFDVDQIAALLGGLDPADLTDLLAGLGGGGFDVDVLLDVLDTVVFLLGDYLPADFDVPEFTPEGLLGVVGLIVNLLNDNLLSQIGLGVVGDLLEDLLAGGSFDGLDPTQLAALLTAFGPGSIDDLDGVPVLGAIVGALLEQAQPGAGAGLPTLDAIPVLGPILGGIVGGVCTLLPFLCP